MKLSDRYVGEEAPFEGDSTLWLRCIPVEARILNARMTLTPTQGQQQQEKFVETFAFERDIDGTLFADDWGIIGSGVAGWMEVDFHARRLLASVRGASATPINATLHIDMGGTFVQVLESGGIKGPGDPSHEWSLSSGAFTDLPGLTVNKFKFMAAGADLSRVRVRSVPTNVSLRLGDMPPFWTHLGELVTAKTSPDFAEVLNAFLSEASAENGFHAVPLVVHSDTIARLDVELTIDYVIEQPILPDYLPEATLPYGYSSRPGVEKDLLTVDLPRGATVARAGGAVSGAFDGTRVVHGEIGQDEMESKVTISPEQTLAQPIQLDKETPVSGIDLPLANTQPGLAGLHLALQADADGKPSGDVLTSAEVTVEKPVPGGSAWGSAALPAEFRFEKGKRYWLVLQSVSGDAYWTVGLGDSAVVSLQVSTNGGLSWRMAVSEQGETPLAATLRLRHAPERFTIPIHLQIGEGKDAKRVDFDHLAPLGRVEFDLEFVTELKEYLASPAAAGRSRRPAPR